MPSESKAACCIAPDSEWATGWPMRTTRLVMLAPFRGRRRSRDRRSRPSRAARSWSRRWRRARRSRRSSPGGGRRGCRSSAPRERRAAVDLEVVAVDLDPRAERAQAGRDPGDPVRFLVAQLAGAADDGRARRPGPRPGTGPGSRRSRRRRRPGRARSPRSVDDRTTQVGDRLADAVVGAASCGRSSMSAPIARRRSMTARRVGLTPTSRRVSSASGWMAPATSQNAAAETSPGTRSVDRLHRQPSFDRPGHRRRPARPPARPARRVPAASAPCGRASRPTRGPSSARPPAAPPAGSPTSPARSARASCSRSPGAGYDRPRSGEGGSRSAGRGARRPSSAAVR